MLAFLGEVDAAEKVERAVMANLGDDSIPTLEPGETATTTEVGDDLSKHIAGVSR